MGKVSLLFLNCTDIATVKGEGGGHWPCLLTQKKEDPGFRNQVREETSPCLLLGAQDQWLGAEQDQLYYGSTGTSCGNCQEMETSMHRACHTPWQPLQNHPSGHLGGWVTAHAMAGRQNAGWTTSKSGHPCQCQNCSQGPPAEETGRRSLLNHPPCPSDDPVGQGTELNWLQLWNESIFRFHDYVFRHISTV